MAFESDRLSAVIWTLGCRVNQYESDAIAEQLEADGFTVVPFGSPADICIVNTCGIAKMKSYISNNCSFFNNITSCACYLSYDTFIKTRDKIHQS